MDRNVSNCLISERDTRSQVKEMLKNAGIHSYESQVVGSLVDYMENYVANILKDACIYMNHANRREINVDDIKLAEHSFTQKTSTRPTRKDLSKLAREHNKIALQNIKVQPGVRLPTENYIISKTNCRLKNRNAQYPYNISVLDSVRQNEVTTMNTVNPAGIATLIRTSTGRLSIHVPLNLAPQRIILKPRISNKVE